MQVVDVNGNMFGYDHLEIIGIDGKPKTPPFSITIGTTAIVGGTVGRVLFEGAGNVVQESANLFWDNTNGRLGIGTSSPAVSIDARNGFNLYTSGAAAGSHYLEAFSTTSTDATLNFRRTAGANGLYRFTLTGAQLNSDNTTGECQLRAANSFFWSIYSNGLERIRIPLTGNILIGTTTDAGFKLDVNGTARVQGVITGSVGSGSLTLGAASANQTAIAITGYFTGNGAITASNINPRGFNANIGAQNTGITLTYNGVAQGQTVISSYFLVSGNINLVDGAIDLNGFNFAPTIVSEVGATIKAFSSGLSAASNRWNLFLSGTAKNYIEGSLLLGTSTDAGFKLDVNGTSRFSGLTNFNADIVLNSNRIFMQSNSGNVLLRMIQTNNLQIYNNNASALLYLNANGSVQIGQTNAINWATFSASGHTIFGSTNTNFFSSGNIGVNTATDAGYKLDVNGTFKVSGAIYDSTNSPGTSGQVLSSTVTGTAWVAAGGGGSSAVTNLGIGTTGIIVTGTTANTITQSISIPANTLSANNTLDVLARFSKADNVGSGNYRVYINTSNTLTGATLVATLYTIAGGASIATHQNQRTFFYNGTNLTCNVGASFSSVTDIQQFVVTPFSMAYNAATDYFLIFAIQLSSATSSSVMTAYRILKYA
jgi:hypothetical protein